MSTSVPPQFEQFVKQEVAAGHYESEDEVLVAALDLLRRRKEGLNQLRTELQPSIDELDQGDGVVVPRGDLRKFLGEIAAEADALRGTEEASNS